MRPRTITPLLYCLGFALFLAASTGNRLRRKEHYRKNCLRLDYLLSKAYHAQIDLIRRGLPARVIQSEFTFAINHFIRINRAVRSKPLQSTCIPDEEWRRVFDDSFRAKYAVHFLNSIRAIVKTLTFLSFESYPILPRLEPSTQKLVNNMWLTCVARLERTPRTKFGVSDFPFPKNVDILHDPGRDEACQQFEKFKTPGPTKHETDARTVLVALTIVSMNLYKKKANSRAIAQMLTHFVGYVFNGIRCTRREGEDIKIPKALLEAYSRNVAMIGSTGRNRMVQFNITPEVVSRVFRREFRSLLSYSCWGHLKYAELSRTTSLPFRVDFLSRLYQGSQYKLVMYYSQTTRLLQRQMPSTRSLNDKGVDRVSISSKIRYLKCEEGYILMPRQEKVQNPMERCCNTICHRWALLMPGYVSYSAEGCCARCNQLNRCDPGVTAMDLSDNNLYSFFIPEYGEQSQIEMFLVAL